MRGKEDGVNGERNFSVLPETELLISALGKVGVGEMVRYEEICKIVARPDIRKARSLLKTAVAEMERRGRFFVTEREKGVRRIPENDAVDLSANARKAIKRKANRARHTLVNIDVSKLDAAGRQKLNLEMTMTSLHAEIEKPGTQKRLLGAVEAAAKTLTANDAAKLLME